MLGKIINHNGNKITIEFDEDINAKYLALVSREKENFVEVDILDNELKSNRQNSLSHALIKDIAKHDGTPLYIAKDKMKEIYFEGTGIKFNHTEATMSVMAKWIDFLIEYVLYEGVPLPKRYSYLLEQDAFFYYACKYRKCCICGASNAQIHHITAVGNRKRNKVDHRLFPFAAVCYEHHKLAHDIGEIAFIKDYLVIPVYLDQQTLVDIGITSNAQLLRFDEQYENEELFNKLISGEG